MAEGGSKTNSPSLQQTNYTRAPYATSMNKIVYPHHTEGKPRQNRPRSSESSAYKSISADDFHYETTLDNNFVLKVYNASITNLNVEVIVNAANEDMAHAGGVAKVIADDAGNALEKECKSFIKMQGPLKVGQNMVTTAGTLPYKAVIHAVGPLWKNYKDKVACLDDLYDCIYNILHRCKNNRYRSVAMTAISAGLFAVPKELCADMYVFATANYSSTRFSSDCPKELHIVDIDSAILRLVKESVVRWKKDPESLNHRSNLPIYLKANPHLAVYSNSNYTDQKNNDKQDIKESTKDSLNLFIKVKKLKDETFPWGGVATQYMFDDKFIVKMYQGDIFKVKHMDAIVCGVGKDLKLRGRIADTMRKSGGHVYEKSYQQMIDKQRDGPPVKCSDVYKCDGGKLEAKFVLHAVLKRVVETDSKATRTYQDCMASVLATVNENKWEKVTIPLIGTGTIQTEKKKLKQCGNALLKALDEFIVINKDKTRIKEIHLVNYKHEANAALVEVFDEASDQMKSAEVFRHKSNGYFGKHSTHGRGSYCKRNSVCEGHRRNSKKMERQEKVRTHGSIDLACGISKRECYKIRSTKETDEMIADVHEDLRETSDAVIDKEHGEKEDDSDKRDDDQDNDDVDTCTACNTKRFEGNLTITYG